MIIYIKTIENKYKFDVKPEHTIYYLKHQIQDILKINYEQQRLIFKGIPMENHYNLNKYSVKENEVIYLLIYML
jgi:hypothetical protein